MFRVIVFPVPGFQNKKQIMGKPGFIRDLLKDTAPKLCVRPGYEPLSFLHFVSILAVNDENSCSKQDLVLVDILLSSKIQFPYLSASSLSEENGLNHSGNVFNKNSDQISFHLSTVGHNFKLNKTSFLQAFYWIESLLSLLWNLFDCNCIIIPCKCIIIQWRAHPLLCWEQNRTWQIKKITACWSLCEITNVNYRMLQEFVPPKSMEVFFFF